MMALLSINTYNPMPNTECIMPNHSYISIHQMERRENKKYVKYKA